MRKKRADPQIINKKIKTKENKKEIILKQNNMKEL